MLQSIAEFLENYGSLGLFIHSFIDAVIFPIPAFFTQVSLSILNPENALWLATVGFIACLLGTPIGYLIGKLLGKAILYKILKQKWIDAATRLFQKNGEAAILVGAFTPIPFKVFTILSGFLNFPLWKLMAFAALGRAVKFYVVGGLFYLFGRAAEGMVKDVSLYLMVIVVPILVIGIYLKRRVDRKKAAAAAATEQAQAATVEQGQEVSMESIQANEASSVVAQEQDMITDHIQEAVTNEEQTTTSSSRLSVIKEPTD